MKQSYLEIVSNKNIAKDVFELKLKGDISEVTRSGQFVNIKIDGNFLRRPISVCDAVGDTLTLIYKVVGNGTCELSRMESGKILDVLVGLGNGYDLTKSGETPLLIGGGAGVPPTYMLCKRLLAENKTPTVILGFNTKDEVFYYDEFLSLGVKVYVATADGSFGEKGFVTDIMKRMEYSYFYTCGPMPMFLAIEKIAKTSGQYSFEERMGCGFGACMGCSCKTKYKNKRICVDGPVLYREEIVW